MCLSICLAGWLSKSIHVFVCMSVCLSLSLSQNMWCSPSRLGFKGSIQGNSSLLLGLQIPFWINLSWRKPIIMVLNYALFIRNPYPLPHEYKWAGCLSDFPVLWYLPHSSTRGYSCIGLSPILAQLCITNFLLRQRSEP